MRRSPTASPRMAPAFAWTTGADGVGPDPSARGALRGANRAGGVGGDPCALGAMHGANVARKATTKGSALMPCPIQACCGNPDARYGREKSVSTVIHNSVNIIALEIG